MRELKTLRCQPRERRRRHANSVAGCFVPLEDCHGLCALTSVVHKGDVCLFRGTFVIVLEKRKDEGPLVEFDPLLLNHRHIARRVTG